MFDASAWLLPSAAFAITRFLDESMRRNGTASKDSNRTNPIDTGLRQTIYQGGHMPVTTFGIGAPINPGSSWGASPYGPQGLSINPYFAHQPYGQPPLTPPLGSLAPTTPFGTQPQQQVVALLQIVPQQLQQLQQLIFAQQQQLQQIQQLLQPIAGQLVQLQQLIQFVLQQNQQFSSSQLPGLTNFSAAAPWGMMPHAFAQPGQVM
jgi:hypothetical protein